MDLWRMVWRLIQRPRKRVIKVLQGAAAESRDFSRRIQAKEGEHYLWGNEFLSEDDASLNFLAVGSPGSGKTVNLMLLLKSVVQRMKDRDSGVRSLIYDSKTDLLSTIGGMLSEKDILILNPFDRRRCAWDLARDITTPAEAEDVAALLVPLEKGNSNPYFTEVAQTLLAGIIIAFNQSAPGDWTLRDLVMATKSSESIRVVLSSSPYTESLLSHFRVETTSENVCSTLSKALSRFESVAASWFLAERKVSLADWIESQKILVMGNSAKAKEPIRRINQLLFTSIAKTVLSRPGKEKAKHWFFLDELRELGRLDMLADMMIVGRSKGAAMVLGFQDIYGLYAEYGKERAQEIIGCAGNYALLRINPTQPETQRWASDVAGQLRYEERKKSSGRNQTKSGTTVSENTSYEVKTENLYIPSYFHLELPEIKRSGQMKGLYYTKGEMFVQPYPAEVLFSDDRPSNVNRVPESNPDFQDFEPLNESSLLLGSWSENDLRRLKLNPGHVITEETTLSHDLLS